MQVEAVGDRVRRVAAPRPAPTRRCRAAGRRRSTSTTTLLPTSMPQSLRSAARFVSGGLVGLVGRIEQDEHLAALLQVPPQHVDLRLAGSRSFGPGDDDHRGIGGHLGLLREHQLLDRVVVAAERGGRSRCSPVRSRARRCPSRRGPARSTPCFCWPVTTLMMPLVEVLLGRRRSRARCAPCTRRPRCRTAGPGTGAPCAGFLSGSMYSTVTCFESVLVLRRGDRGTAEVRRPGRTPSTCTGASRPGSTFLRLVGQRELPWLAVRSHRLFWREAM